MRLPFFYDNGPESSLKTGLSEFRTDCGSKPDVEGETSVLPMVEAVFGSALSYGVAVRAGMQGQWRTFPVACAAQAADHSSLAGLPLALYR